MVWRHRGASALSLPWTTVLGQMSHWKPEPGLWAELWDGRWCWGSQESWEPRGNLCWRRGSHQEVRLKFFMKLPFHALTGSEAIRVQGKARGAQGESSGVTGTGVEISLGITVLRTEKTSRGPPSQKDPSKHPGLSTEIAPGVWGDGRTQPNKAYSQLGPVLLMSPTILPKASSQPYSSAFIFPKKQPGRPRNKTRRPKPRETQNRK